MGVKGQGTGYRHALLLPAGQSGGTVIDLVGDVHQFQQFADPFVDRRFIVLPALHRQGDIFINAAPFDQRKLLKNHADPFSQLTALLLAQVLDLGAVNFQAAALVGFQAVDAAQQGGFPRAAAANQSVNFTGLDGQADIFQHLQRAERFTEIINFNHNCPSLVLLKTSRIIFRK